jgi:hypothetical protein
MNKNEAFNEVIKEELQAVLELHYIEIASQLNAEQYKYLELAVFNQIGEIISDGMRDVIDEWLKDLLVEISRIIKLNN